MRETTNFRALRVVKEHYLQDKSIKKGFLEIKEKSLIVNTLELNDRDLISLQDLRDFAVMFLTSDPKDDKGWDCMSAVTCVIDEWKLIEIVRLKKLVDNL